MFECIIFLYNIWITSETVMIVEDILKLSLSDKFAVVFSADVFAISDSNDALIFLWTDEIAFWLGCNFPENSDIDFIGDCSVSGVNRHSLFAAHGVEVHIFDFETCFQIECSVVWLHIVEGGTDTASVISTNSPANGSRHLNLN